MTLVLTLVLSKLLFQPIQTFLFVVAKLVFSVPCPVIENDEVMLISLAYVCLIFLRQLNSHGGVSNYQLGSFLQSSIAESSCSEIETAAQFRAGARKEVNKRSGGPPTDLNKGTTAGKFVSLRLRRVVIAPYEMRNSSVLIGRKLQT